MEALMMLVILVFMIMTMFVINLVSRSSRRHEGRSQKQGHLSLDTLDILFHVFVTPDVIGEMIEGMAEVGTAIVEGVGTILEATIDVIDL